MCPECGGELIYIPEFNERVVILVDIRKKKFYNKIINKKY